MRPIHLLPSGRIMRRLLPLFCLAGTFCPGFHARAQELSRPNIVLILVDQMRSDYLGPHAPALMSLANGGILFTHAYTAAPLCQPSRTSIITGLYPSQTKICGNQTGPLRDELRDSTFMNKLQAAGYYTALIGKHHYIDRYATGTNMVTSDEEEVKRYGFDHVVQCADVGEHMPNKDHTENIDDYIIYLKGKGLYKRYVDNIGKSLKEGTHPLEPDDSEDGFIGLQACAFIENYDKDQPFYLNVSFIGPHPPYAVPGEPATRPENTEDPVAAAPSALTSKRRAIYTDMIAHIDRYVGRLVKTLKDKGLYENTVFIFTADHGDMLGDHGIWDKRFFYEQSVSVPFFISGKGIPGRDVRIGVIRSQALISSLDIYPTVLGLAGIEDNKGDRQGRDLLDIIANQEDAFRDAVYSQLGTLVMIRTANWKMVFDPEQGGACYLFNLMNDPDETNNLAGVAGYEEITAGLTAKLLSFYIRMDQFTQMKEQLRLQKVRVGG